MYPANPGTCPPVADEEEYRLEQIADFKNYVISS
jgi:hypothetical protein